ncbi:Hypothetical predicted protein [Pelobates cultripes]|uniref:Uncharacterized protein n=1 Tax=Pelobates cultripes TaxID=61616 RepID=A0AAD1RWA7_PELCU|nr:Hypothetical predicted protein [Pelobates cultripes]
MTSSEPRHTAHAQPALPRMRENCMTQTHCSRMRNGENQTPSQQGDPQISQQKCGENAANRDRGNPRSPGKPCTSPEGRINTAQRTAESRGGMPPNQRRQD